MKIKLFVFIFSVGSFIILLLLFVNFLVQKPSKSISPETKKEEVALKIESTENKEKKPVAVLKKFHITGRTIVFFGMTQNEYDLKSESEKEELVEVLDDFYYYSNEIVPFLQKHKIQFYHTTNDRIIIIQQDKTTTYNRKEFDNIVGFIMVDINKKPKVVLGVETGIDLKATIPKYFKF